MTTIPKEYEHFDFGFSAVDDPNETLPVLESTNSNDLDEIKNNLSVILAKLDSFDRPIRDQTEAEYIEDIRKLEQIIIPLLNNLLKTADKPYIYWKDRGPIIQSMIDRVLEITRKHGS